MVEQQEDMGTEIQMTKTIKKILLSPWTAIITLVLILGVRVNDPQFVESIRLRYFDTLITEKAPTENNIVVVNIDEIGRAHV